MNYFEEQEKGRPKRVMYVGAKKDEDYADQIAWGNHADPRPLLVVGREYTVAKEEVRSWHTKVFLEDDHKEAGLNGKHFNSVWFVDVT